jgi:glycosyltransferase involved in cell wall biosynthesis
MNIGIYIRTLRPPSPASARFQETILEGLSQIQGSRFHFTVLSDAIPPGFRNTSQITYVALQSPSAAEARARRWKLLLGGVARRALRTLGASSSRAYGKLTQWMTYEPAYFRQLRALNVRLIWNLGVDVLPSFLPFVMVVWDCNYRIHPMFPEYSYLTDGYKFFDRTTPLLQGASYVIVGTEQGKREVVETFGVSARKVRVIPFPTPALPGAGACAPGAPYVFYPARFWPHKNHVVLVRALSLIRDRWGVAVRCVFSGINNGNLDYIMRTAEALGVREQIEYLGNVSVNQLADLYRNAEALVYCSAVGPDNFPPLEAMSVGCPVIAAEVPGAREQYGDAVIYFNPTSEEQLAAEIKRLLDDPKLRATMVAKGRRRAEQWTPLNYAETMVGVLEEFALTARMWEHCDFQLN